MPRPGGVASSAPYSGGPALAACASTFQFAVVSDCHTPLKSGLPFASRGISVERCASAVAASIATAQIVATATRLIAFLARLVRRLDSQDRAVRRKPRAARPELLVALDEHVDVAVLRLAHVADPRVERHEQRLAALGLERLIERNALQLLAAQAADE